MVLAANIHFIPKFRNIPKDLVGRILNTEQELKQLFPQDETFLDVYLKNRVGALYCKFYAREKRAIRDEDEPYVAYKCNSCEKIIIGMPKKKLFWYHCHNCDHSFGTFDF